MTSAKGKWKLTDGDWEKVENSRYQEDTAVDVKSVPDAMIADGASQLVKQTQHQLISFLKEMSQQRDHHQQMAEHFQKQINIVREAFPDSTP